MTTSTYRVDVFDFLGLPFHRMAGRACVRRRRRSSIKPEQLCSFLRTHRVKPRHAKFVTVSPNSARKATRVRLAYEGVLSARHTGTKKTDRFVQTIVSNLDLLRFCQRLLTSPILSTLRRGRHGRSGLLVDKLKPVDENYHQIIDFQLISIETKIKQMKNGTQFFEASLAHILVSLLTHTHTHFLPLQFRTGLVWQRCGEQINMHHTSA